MRLDTDPQGYKGGNVIMSLQVEKLEKNMAKLTIEVSAEELEKAIEGAYQKNKNKISIPGFRKGKAPRKMIEQMYGKSVFYEDVANALIPDAYDKALEECEEQIVSSPKIDVTQLEAGKPFIFTAEVALKPEVTLGKYKGVKVDKIEVKVTDEEVDAEINRERESNARTINVEDRAVKDGDMTVIDFEGFVDGVAFEGGKGENHSLTIGSGSFIPGFEEGLIGAELNKETEVNVTFPEDYHAAELAGKPAVFKCTVKEIKEKLMTFMVSECGRHDITRVYFMLTNILEESTELLFYGEGSQQMAEIAFERKPDGDTFSLPGVVSRKKQLIPAMMEAAQLMNSDYA